MVTTIRLDGAYDFEPVQWLDDHVSKTKVRGRNGATYIGEGWRLTWVDAHRERRSYTEVEIDDRELALEFVLRFS